MFSDTTSLQNFKTSMFVSKPFSRAGSFPGFHVHTSGKIAKPGPSNFAKTKWRKKLSTQQNFNKADSN